MANLPSQLPDAPPNHEWRRIVCTDCGHTIDVPIYCKDRFCGLCSAPRRAKIAARILSLMRQVPRRPGYRWRFITLTQRKNVSARDGLDTIFERFKRLRSRNLWLRNVWGGVSVAEVTVSENGFHVHLHILALCRFIPQHQLSKAWAGTGAGAIVDIRLAGNSGTAEYLCKYITKESVPEAHRKALNEAFFGRRLYTTFGKAHDLRIVIFDKPKCCPNCQGTHWMPLDILINHFGATSYLSG